MATIAISDDKLKELLKAAVIEVLEERQDLICDAVVEVMEDIGMARAIEEGLKSGTVSKEKVFKLLDRQS